MEANSGYMDLVHDEVELLSRLLYGTQEVPQGVSRRATTLPRLPMGMQRTQSCVIEWDYGELYMAWVMLILTPRG